ncbi:YheC/YheD family protein [Brevibacillus sp. B_LB10_24]|uniref:YheC/YheD family protein n=1 Tax=Brevibacillus sp. B_LB10_24 TaxID=3380645 RepID=UPI0038B7907F
MNKWEKYTFLHGETQIRSMLPETRLMTADHVQGMLQKHGSIILKPIDGSGGRGVILVSSAENGRSLIQIKLTKQTAANRDLFSVLTNEILGDFLPYLNGMDINQLLASSYIIQQRIPLVEADHRPFDIRVMVQRKSDSPWTVTGKLAKLADSGYAITNVNLGASILPVETVLARSLLREHSQKKLLSQLDQAALLVARRFQQKLPVIREIGLDMCFDPQGNPWIIEANFKPHDYLFLALEDKTMYQAIQEYRQKEGEN